MPHTTLTSKSVSIYMYMYIETQDTPVTVFALSFFDVNVLIIEQYREQENRARQVKKKNIVI